MSLIKQQDALVAARRGEASKTGDKFDDDDDQKKKYKAIKTTSQEMIKAN